MNDLISRKALLEAMKHKCKGNCKKCEHSTFLSDDEHCGLIDSQPTAYDPDKVVGELEELKKLEEGEGNNGYCPDEGRMCRYMFDSIGCSYCAFEKAIEIVRKGGVE